MQIYYLLFILAYIYWPYIWKLSIRNITLLYSSIDYLTDIHVYMHVIYLYFISDDTPGETSRNPSIKNICVEDEINNDEYSYCENDDIKKIKKGI